MDPSTYFVKHAHLQALLLFAFGPMEISNPAHRAGARQSGIAMLCAHRLPPFGLCICFPPRLPPTFA